MATVAKEDLQTSKGVNFQASCSSKDRCWRLVHDGEKVLALFESEGYTHTINTLFVGTKEECEAEIARFKLIPLPEESGEEPICSE